MENSKRKYLSNQQINQTNQTNQNKKEHFKFPETDGEKLIKELSSKDKELSSKYDKEKKFKPSDVSVVGGKFDTKAFNLKVGKIQEIARQRRKLRDQIKLARLKYQPLDLNTLTIDQLKKGLYLDLYYMFNEIKHMQSFNFVELDRILSKNYRKLSLLIILLLIIIMTYLLVKFLE
jgi:hypothetical protein